MGNLEMVSLASVQLEKWLTSVTLSTVLAKCFISLVTPGHQTDDRILAWQQ